MSPKATLVKPPQTTTRRRNKKSQIKLHKLNQEIKDSIGICEIIGRIVHGCVKAAGYKSQEPASLVTLSDADVLIGAAPWRVSVTLQRSPPPPGLSPALTTTLRCKWVVVFFFLFCRKSHGGALVLTWQSAPWQERSMKVLCQNLFDSANTLFTCHVFATFVFRCASHCPCLFVLRGVATWTDQ